MNCHLKRSFTREISSAGSSRSGKLVYLVSGGIPDGSDPGAAALETVRGTAPEYLGNTPRGNLTLTRCHGSGVYEVEVEYRYSSETRTDNKIGDMRWSFEVCGNRERVQTGVLVRRITGNAGISAPDPGNRIKWNGRSGEAEQVEGAVKLVAFARERCVATFRENAVTTSFKRTLMQLTGCVNNSTFHGWSAGEVLFLGISTGLPYWNSSHVKLIDLTYSFAIRLNRSSYSCFGINAGSVKGWELPWGISRTDPDGNSPKVLGVYVSRLYDPADFSALKIH